MAFWWYFNSSLAELIYSSHSFTYKDNVIFITSIVSCPYQCGRMGKLANLTFWNLWSPWNVRIIINGGHPKCPTIGYFTMPDVTLGTHFMDGHGCVKIKAPYNLAI